MKTTLVFTIICGTFVYSAPHHGGPHPQPRHSGPHHGGPHHGGPHHGGPHHAGPRHHRPQQSAPKKYVQSPVILSNTEWQPLTVVDNGQWTIPIVPTPQPKKRESKPQHHKRESIKAMPEKVMKEEVMSDKMFSPFEDKSDTYILAPTALPTYSRPVVRRKKDSPYHPDKQIRILSHNKNVSQKEDKAYHFDFESENGITRTEDGYIKAVADSEYPAQVMSGSYSYTGPDGNIYTITYVADENGYRAEGSHLPVPPAPTH